MELSSITFNRSCRRCRALVGRRGARKQAVEIANKDDDLFLRLSATHVPAAPDSGGPMTKVLPVLISQGEAATQFPPRGHLRPQWSGSSVFSGWVQAGEAGQRSV